MTRQQALLSMLRLHPLKDSEYLCPLGSRCNDSKPECCCLHVHTMFTCFAVAYTSLSLEHVIVRCELQKIPLKL